MRRLVRPILLFTCLCGFTTLSQSQPAPGGGYNFVLWSPGSPAWTKDGVNVSMDLRSAPGYSCTEVTFRVIEQSTGKTLGEYNTTKLGAPVTKAFTGIPTNAAIRITADATFQNGAWFDFKSIEIQLAPIPPLPPRP